MMKAAERQRRSRSGSAPVPSAQGSSSAAPCVGRPAGCSRYGCRSGPERCSSSGPTPGSRPRQLSRCRSRWDRPRSCKQFQFLLGPEAGPREARRLTRRRTNTSRNGEEQRESEDKVFYLVGQAGPVLSVQLARFWADQRRRDCELQLPPLIGCWPGQVQRGLGSVQSGKSRVKVTLSCR